MGYGMVSFNLNVLAKFDQIWPLLGLLVNFDENSLPGARKLQTFSPELLACSDFR